MPPTNLSIQDINNICDRYHSGKNTSELAKEYNVSNETIRRWLKKRGVKRRASRTSLKNSVNETYFSKIDNPDKAYWLGLFAADGCLSKSVGTIRSVRLYLAEKDGKIIEDFASDLQYTGKLQIDPIKKQKGIVFNSPQMCSDLINLGILKWKKEDNPELFNNIPNIYKRDFIRGFFDGDGCISCNVNIKKPTKQYYLSFSANKHWNNTQKVVQEYISDSLGISNTGVKQRTNSSSIKWVGNAQVERLTSWLYDDCNRKLNRKYVKHLAIQNRDFLNYWQSFHNWEFKQDVRELKLFKTTQEINDIIDRFTKMISLGFEPLNLTGPANQKLMQNEILDLSEYGDKVNKAIINNDVIKTSQSVGQNVILHHQPAIWGVRQGKSKTFFELDKCESTCRRAVKAMLTSGKKINPKRLKRELGFAGISRASILAVPTIMAVIKRFGLQGKWFDPCAGWGTRMLAAHILKLPYEATDPAVQYYGLLRLKKWLCDKNVLNPEHADNFVLHHFKFQKICFPNADFLFTSPPFYDKEDYGLGKIDQTFEEWYESFIVEIIKRAKNMRVVFHVDNRICRRLEKDFKLEKVVYQTGRRSKAPNEWFVEIK